MELSTSTTKNGIRARTGEFVADGKLFTTNESGAVISKKYMENGWSNYQGKWYYYQNGIAYTGWAGAYYVRNGEMVCNSIVEWKGKRYYVGEDGKYLVNTWCNDGYSYCNRRWFSYAVVKRLTERSTISIGKVWYIHISFMEKVSTQKKVHICYQMTMHRAGS
ncbi:MAG: hypothetical protein ACLTRS_02240 [Lachnospiraceae bacterium]